MIVIIVSKNSSFDGTIMELVDEKYFLVERFSQNVLMRDKEYSKEDLEKLYGSFTYKELLFD